MAVFGKAPPEMTGDSKADCQRLADYLGYLQEQVDFSLSNLERKVRTLEAAAQNGKE